MSTSTTTSLPEAAQRRGGPPARGPAGVRGRPQNAPVELLTACHEFMAMTARMNAHDDAKAPGDPEKLTQADLDALITRWYRSMRRIATLPARTSEGLQAKIRAAHAAMCSLEDFDIGTEEKMAFSVLSDLVGGDAAAPSREPDTLFLLRRLAVLPRPDQLDFVVAAFSVFSGQTPESAHQGVGKNVRSRAAMVGWETRRRTRASA